VRAGQLYGLISRWFEGHLGEAGHHAPRKAYTVSPLRPLDGHPGDQAAVDVGVLDDDLVGLLLDGAARLAGAGGRLGGQAVRGLPWPDGEPVRLDQGADWSALAGVPAATAAFDVELLSPTTFRSGRIYLPFPTPGLVLGHLREQWTQWGPPVPHPAIDECEVEVAGHRLVCEHRELRGRSIAGSTGLVSYRIRSGDDAHRAGVARWLAVLPFAGLGADTRMGLGQAQLVTTGAVHHQTPGRSTETPQTPQTPVADRAVVPAGDSALGPAGTAWPGDRSRRR
jgi:hypothetical protein